MKTPQEFFSQNPSLEECKTRFGEPPSDRLYVFNRSLLHIFAESYVGCNPIPIIQWFLGPPYCLNIDTQSSDLSPTPLMVAGYEGKIAMIHALVKCGANVNATVPPGVYHGRNRGYTVLEYVSSGESKEAVLCLLDLGANRIFAKEVPLYVTEFMAKKKQLRQICTVLLGLRFRRLHPAGFEKRLLPVITQLVWAQRFEI
jgi:hypothetical protein